MPGAKKKKQKQAPAKSKTVREKANSEQLSFAEVNTWQIPPVLGNVVEIDRLPAPIWTETKAQLIANYLRLFLMITKHGVYIDGFAGPQDKENPTSWAAKLVLELVPPWMKTFFLCEMNRTSFAALSTMVSQQKATKGRSIQLQRGDFNKWIDEVLCSGAIKDKTATFALLDQRATECEWSTVEKLATHKRGDKKIELFYFFPTGWVHRSVSETHDKSILDRWWGDKTWRRIEGTSQEQAASLFLKRVKALGYRDVKSWPISSRDGGAGRTMYHMIHATDHLEAPKLMFRAYRDLVGSGPGGKQAIFDFEDGSQQIAG